MNNGFFVIEEVMPVSQIPLPEKLSIEKVDASHEGFSLAQCPYCKKKTLKIENGCHSCLNEACGFSKCDM